MSIFQIIASFFALFMLYFVHVHRRKKILSAFEAGMWYGVWILFIYLALFPKTLRGMVELFHFTRVFDLLTVLAFMVLSVIIFMSYFAQRESSKKIEELARKHAFELEKLKQSHTEN